MIRMLGFPALVVALALGAGAVLIEPVRAGGGACHEAPDEREGTGELVLMIANCFSPTVLRVEPGTEVRFQNNDTMEHHIAGVAGMWGTGYDRKVLAESSATYSFDEPGTYPYSCYLHLGMSGVVVVGDGSFVADARTSGSGAQVVAQSVASPREVSAGGGAGAPSALQEAGVAPVVEEGSSRPDRLVMALLGAVIGGVVVAVGFGARGLLRG